MRLPGCRAISVSQRNYRVVPGGEGSAGEPFETGSGTSSPLSGVTVRVASFWQSSSTEAGQHRFSRRRLSPITRTSSSWPITGMKFGMSWIGLGT